MASHTLLPFRFSGNAPRPRLIDFKTLDMSAPSSKTLNDLAQSAAASAPFTPLAIVSAPFMALAPSATPSMTLAPLAAPETADTPLATLLAVCTPLPTFSTAVIFLAILAAKLAAPAPGINIIANVVGEPKISAPKPSNPAPVPPFLANSVSLNLVASVAPKVLPKPVKKSLAP